MGDIHGQFYDLVWMLQKTKARVGEKQNCKLLFLGDYVDRGLYGIEVMAYLFALKVHNPGDVFLLRGNHETREMTTFYNFRDQCLKAYDLDVYERFSDAFESLPVGAVVNKTFLSVHGGISPQLTSLDKVNQIDRHLEPRAGDLLMDLLWADPMKQKKASTHSFETNEVRGVSYKFGYQPLKQLLD